MKQQISYRTANAGDSAALPAGNIPPFLPFARTKERRYVRIALPSVPRRQLSVCERTRRAALFASQLAFWQASGGDYLRSVPSAI